MMIEDIEGVWFCKDCDKTFIFAKDVEYHNGKTGHKAELVG